MKLTRRERLHIKQGGLCAYCRKVFDWYSFTADHVIPLSMGGSGGKKNLIGACVACNQAKANRMPTAKEIVAVIKEKTRRDGRNIEGVVRLALYFQAEVFRVSGVAVVINDDGLIKGKGK